eukprot:TRINITY_DN11422_c1_g1_i1.p1 TRINITY_DN11422_c1_g1~~TRINITY_DN11422_c1_g1_i1.p1  ORF type:complete len:395 (+),score=88.04 TRINITY_DN11422_c1_g1_i1:50-1234(+)
METGRVRKWDEARGAGFLTTSKGEDLFVVRRECGDGSLVVGAEVQFSIKEDKRGRKTAAGVHGVGVAEKGKAGEAKIASREAKKTEDGKLVGTVERWNDLIGKGTIEHGKSHINVARWAVVNGGSLVKGATVTFDVELDENGEKRAVNVQGEAVVDTGDLVEEEPETILGVKHGTVLKWSAANSEGVLSWDTGSSNIIVKSTQYSLSVGSRVTYEIEDIEGELRAKNVEGPGVLPVLPKRAVSDRIKSMKFMKRKEEQTKRMEVQTQALREKEERDLESKKMKSGGLNNNIRVIVSDDFPLAYHAMGRKKFGDVVPKAETSSSSAAVAPVKKPSQGSRYTNTNVDEREEKAKRNVKENFFTGEVTQGGKGGGKPQKKRKFTSDRGAAGKKRKKQ